MKKFTIKTIRSFNPCYDPAEHLPENFKGTVLDILNHETIPFVDKLWVVLLTDFISERIMRLFAVWSARQVQHLNSDQRVIDCLDFMDFYIESINLIDDPDFKEALNLDRVAARAAAGDARAAARAAQKNKLIELIKSGIKTGDVY